MWVEVLTQRVMPTAKHILEGTAEHETVVMCALRLEHFGTTFPRLHRVHFPTHKLSWSALCYSSDQLLGWTSSCCLTAMYKTSNVHAAANNKGRVASVNVTAWRRETEWKSLTLVCVSEWILDDNNDDDNDNNEYWSLVPRVVSTCEDSDSYTLTLTWVCWRVELVWEAACPEWVCLYFWQISAFLWFKLGPESCSVTVYSSITSSPHSLWGSFLFSFCRQDTFVIVNKPVSNHFSAFVRTCLLPLLSWAI